MSSPFEELLPPPSSIPLAVLVPDRRRSRSPPALPLVTENRPPNLSLVRSTAPAAISAGAETNLGRRRARCFSPEPQPKPNRPAPPHPPPVEAAGAQIVC